MFSNSTISFAYVDDIALHILYYHIHVSYNFLITYPGWKTSLNRSQWITWANAPHLGDGHSIIQLSDWLWQYQPGFDGRYGWWANPIFNLAKTFANPNTIFWLSFFDTFSMQDYKGYFLNSQCVLKCHL